MNRSDITRAAGLAFLIALYFHNILDSENIVADRDLAVFFIPPRKFWVDTVLSEGVFPLWNPYYAFGHPLFATLQDNVLYPFSILYFLLPFALAFNCNIVLHFILAAWSMYALMRVQKASPNAALAAAVCFVFGGYLISIIGTLSSLQSVAWFPLFFICFGAALKREEGGLWPILSGLVACLMFLGGGVEICYVAFALAFLMTLFPQTLIEASEMADPRRRVLCFLAMLCVMLGLSAVQLLPFAELIQQSTRSSAINYDEATAWSMHPKDIASFLLPDMYGYSVDLKRYWVNQNWLKSMYTGAIPFILASFCFAQKTRKTQCLLLIALCSLLLAFGKFSPVYPLLYKFVPPFNKIRYPVKFIFLAIFVIAMAAGFGFDRLVEGIRNRDSGTANMIRSLFLLGFLCIVNFGLLNFYEREISDFADSQGWGVENYNHIEINLHNLRRVLCFAGLFAFLVFLYMKYPARATLFAGFLLTVLVADLFFIHQGYYTIWKTEDYFAPGENLNFIKKDPSLFRVFLPSKSRESNTIVIRKDQRFLEMPREKIMDGYSVMHRVFDSNGALVPPRQRHKNLVDLIESQPHPDDTTLFNLMNVKYLITLGKVQSPQFRLVHFHLEVPEDETSDSWEEKPTIKIYENLKVLPRAFFVSGCHLPKDDREFKDIFSRKEFHPDRLLLLEKQPENFIACDGKTHYDESAQNSVRFTSYKSREVELEAETDRPALLFMSETHYPGWQAWVDSQPVEILRADYQYRAVVLEKGRHQVRMEYNPWSFKIGAAISVFTIFVCVTILFVRRRTGPAPVAHDTN